MKTVEIRPGVTQITFSKKEAADMQRDIAARSGLTLRQYRRELKKALNDHWCHCENSDPEQITFCDDGENINEHCCQKHHYHCGNCGKIVQVG